MPEPGDGPAGGLRDAARQVAASLLDIGRTRLELASVELEEERLHIARLWVLATVTLFLLFVGLVLAVAWLVLVTDPSNRLAMLGGLALVFLAAAAIGAWHWRRSIASKPAFLHATLGELQRDAAAFTGAEAP